MGFMSKAARDKLRGLGRTVTDNVKGRVTGPTKDATGKPNSQSPRRRSFGGRPAGGNIDMNRSSARGTGTPRATRAGVQAPSGRNPELQRASAGMDAARSRQQSRSANTPPPSGRSAGMMRGATDTNRRMARSGIAGGRVRMFSEGGEAQKTGGTARGGGMAKPSKFKLY
tara:strand:+ start:54 stop:563 length:510 start_codon:yes stop_codon:yes gene_type:complete